MCRQRWPAQDSQVHEVLHDVARDFEKRLINSNLLEASDQPVFDREKVHV